MTPEAIRTIKCDITMLRLRIIRLRRSLEDIDDEGLNGLLADYIARQQREVNRLRNKLARLQR